MSKKESGIIVRDRRGVLYAIPPELAKQHVINESDFAAAAEFYKAEEDDVTGQTISQGAFGFMDGLPEDTLINRPFLKISF